MWIFPVLLVPYDSKLNIFELKTDLMMSPWALLTLIKEKNNSAFSDMDQTTNWTKMIDRLLDTENFQPLIAGLFEKLGSSPFWQFHAIIWQAYIFTAALFTLICHREARLTHQVCGPSLCVRVCVFLKQVIAKKHTKPQHGRLYCDACTSQTPVSQKVWPGPTKGLNVQTGRLVSSPARCCGASTVLFQCCCDNNSQPVT